MRTGNANELRRAFGQFPTGVVALCGLADSAPAGLVANSFTSVSLEPPLVSVCVQNSSRTWAVLRQLPRIGVSFLAEHHDRACRQLSAKTGERFREIPWESAESGAVFVSDAAVWLECSISECFEAGDHELVLLLVEHLSVKQEARPLVFHSSTFRQLAF